nr:integrase, catalytic region, zinc finger, CCHC-type, peptidase aspartic, catalytic [Tanacetum cinerariifolium]
MARQCTQPKRQWNATWYKEKAMLAEAQEARQILDEEQLTFLTDPGIPTGQVQTIVPHNPAFQTEDLDTYYSDWKFPVNYLRSKSCKKCLNLDAESFKSKKAYNDLLNKYLQLEKHCISLEVSIQLKQEVFQNDESCVCQNAPEIPKYFEKNDLKAKLKDKDTTICKLKDTIKSLRHNNKEEIVDHDRCDLATINAELENSVVKLLYENERLCEEINNVKQVFKDQVDSIKQTHVLQKEQCDSLINKLNLKSAKHEDSKAQIQDKVFVITSLKNDLRKLKGKATVDNTAQIPSATTVVPGMFKLDLEHLAPKLMHNRESHIFYLKHTQDQANIIRGIVEQAKAKQPLDNELDFACKYAKKIQELLVYVQDTCPNAIRLSETKVARTPMTKIKKVTFAKPILMNFVSKFLGTVRFGNDQIARIMGYGDYQLGNVVISRPVDLTLPMLSTYVLDTDHAGCQDTRCSTSGSAQFLGDKLVSCSSKKQKSTAISSTEA